MTSYCKLLLALIFGFFIRCVISSPFQETNAQRLSRGLPPKPPQVLLRRNGATPASSSNDASPSNTPTETLIGKLEVRERDGTILGRVGNLVSPARTMGLTNSDFEEDLIVSFSFRPISQRPWNIEAIDPSFPQPFYIGGGSSSASSAPSLGSNSPNAVGFINVHSTSPLSRPVLSPERNGYEESAIWKIDRSTDQLRAHWINNDGSSPRTILAYDKRKNSLLFVGDIVTYNRATDDSAVVVHLFLVPE